MRSASTAAGAPAPTPALTQRLPADAPRSASIKVASTSHLVLRLIWVNHAVGDNNVISMETSSAFSTGRSRALDIHFTQRVFSNRQYTFLFRGSFGRTINV